jgi:hypothetical protein
LELARADADFTRVETSRIEIPSLSSCRNVGYDEIRELLFLECGYAGVADRVIQAVSIDGLPAGAPVHTALEDPPYTFGTARDGSGIHLAGIDDLSELTMVRVDDVSGTIAARATVPIELVDGRVREWGRAAAWRHGAWSFLAETLQVQRVDESGEIQVAGTFEPPADFSFLRLDWVGPDDLVGVGTPETDLTAPLTLLLARFDATSGRSLASPTLVARDVLLSGVLGGVIKQGRARGRLRLRGSLPAADGRPVRARPRHTRGRSPPSAPVRPVGIHFLAR